MAAIQTLNPKAEFARAAAALQVNTSAAIGLQNVLKTNLGPKGTMKMLVSGSGDIKITKDGNVLLNEMQIQHPTASLIAKVATAQDDITGDGTTSNVLIIGELLKQADLYISEGLHPRIVTEGFDLAKVKALEVLEEIKVKREMDRDTLINVAKTSLRTKVHSKLADVLTEAIVDAVLAIRQAGQEIDLHMVEIMEMMHKSDADTKLVRGLVMDHGARHPDMKKKVTDAYILTCNVSMEYEKSSDNQMRELHLCWMGNIEQLKQFVSDNIELNGVWVSPGGDKKKYRDGDTSISWRKGNKVLRIEGKGKNQINAKLCSIICNSGISLEEAGAANNLSSVSHCRTSELSVEMEGVKLDIAIAERDICNNKFTIENVEARLNKLTEEFGKVSQQLDNCRKAETYFLNNQHKDRSSPTFEYSNMADMGHSTREKLCYEKATSTIDLTVNNQINDVDSVVESSPDNMPHIEILDKASSTIDLTVNNQINDANVVEFSPESTPPIEILDRATENSRSNQSCIILNSCFQPKLLLGGLL
ncbi:T-complex 1 subunit zeta-like [Paramuricea clavata]|uniref:T-complex 1 subunit zeta-like n=1 Tax=Paramuricea clavata TaxID=317549 RepID=A0A6S7HN20_PARCT|nr:T-complex 1 subunit zeta-like [Paramuricea clavata]